MLDFASASYGPIAAIATTPQALKTLQSLTHSPQQAALDIWVSPSLQQHLNTTNNDGPGNFSDQPLQTYDSSLAEHVAALWSSHRALIFCLAAGAATRLIAPGAGPVQRQHLSPDGVMRVLSEQVRKLCDAAIENADRAERKTVMDRDF